jgi:rRNA small subunit pseudouridine methyltransferase Nep1
MGRPYGVKGRKKKRKLEEEATSDAAPPAEEVEELPPPEESGGEKKGNEEEEEEAAAGEEGHAAVDGLPIVPRMVDGKRRPGAIFVLERACLEVGKVGKVQWFGCINHQ